MIDLHLHSTCSDGTEPPERVVELALSASCRAIALTDHDTLGGLDVAEKAARSAGLEFVRGCEVSCSFRSGSIHLLCYFVDGRDGPLQSRLSSLIDDRIARNVELAKRLASLGLKISYEEVLAEAKGASVGRPHFAAVLMRNGEVSSIDQAFDLYLADGRPGFIARAHVAPQEIIELAHGSGALVVLAHPGSLGVEEPDLRAALQELSRDGLDGLECHYGRYGPAHREALVDLARGVGLVPTGGSDFHGRYKPDLSVGTGTGDLDVPYEFLDELRERRSLLR